MLQREAKLSAGNGSATTTGHRGRKALKSLALGKAVAGMRPVLEHVMTDAGVSFVWRCDDYPW